MCNVVSTYATSEYTTVPVPVQPPYLQPILRRVHCTSTHIPGYTQYAPGGSNPAYAEPSRPAATYIHSALSRRSRATQPNTSHTVSTANQSTVHIADLRSSDYLRPQKGIESCTSQTRPVTRGKHCLDRCHNHLPNAPSGVHSSGDGSPWTRHTIHTMRAVNHHLPQPHPCVACLLPSCLNAKATHRISGRSAHERRPAAAR